jgi:peptidoglycan/LPS O-acetylase OafA/YrhL
MGHFNPLSYGVLFFVGLALGYRYKTQRHWFETGPARPRMAVAIAALAVLVAYALAYRHYRHGGPFGGGNSLLSIHALIITAAAYYLLYWLLATPTLPRLAALVRAFLALPPLLLMGRNSLFVYALHVIVVALAKAAVVALQATGVVPGQVMMLAIMLAGLLAMLAATALKNRYLPWTS